MKYVRIASGIISNVSISFAILTLTVTYLTSLERLPVKAIFATPIAFAVTTPLEFTDAIEGFNDEYVYASIDEVFVTLIVSVPFTNKSISSLVIFASKTVSIHFA